MAKVWSSFSKNVKGRAVNFKIQEANDRAVEIVEMLAKYQIPNEPFIIAAGVAKDPVALKEHQNMLEQIMGGEGQQLDVVSLDDGTIVGASIMNLLQKDQSEDFSEMKFSNDNLKKLFAIWNVFNTEYSTYKDKSASCTFDDWGYVVHPDYQGIGIEEEIFKARIPICKAKNVPMVYSWIHMPGLAQALEPSGWKIIAEINLKKFEKETGVTFPEVNSTGYVAVAKV